MFEPPSLSLDALRDRIDRLAGGEEPRSIVVDLLPGPLPVVPGRGWLVVTGDEASGVVAVSTLEDGPALDRLRADLELLNGRIFFDGADLSREQAAAAARVEASLAMEAVAELCESYRDAVGREALVAIHGSARLHVGVPEVCLGVSAWVKCAG